MAGPIIVEGPDGQEYEFPEGTSPEVMKQAMRKRYASGPAAASTSVMSPQATSVLQSAFPGSPKTAAQPETWQASANEYLANMPERERGGIANAADAALFNIANTLTAGGLQRAGNEVVPGKNLGDAAMQEGESYYPTASVVGRGVGYAVPASSGGKVANMAIQDIVTATGARNLVPKAISQGTGAAARATRYLGRAATLAPTGALQVGAYEGLVEQPVRDFMAGEESTMGSRVQAGVNALANPVNYGVLPVLSAAGRVGKSILTGVAAPGDVQRAVSKGSGGAVPLSEGQLAADAAQILDTQAMNGIDPRGFKLVERILRQSGLTDSDISAANAKVRDLLKAAPDALAGRLTVGQVYAKALYDLDKTQAGENILKVLRERRNVTDVKDRSPSIVGNEVRDLRGSQVDFITQSAESNLGAGKRIDIKNAVADTKKQIGGEYERVLAEADPARPEAPALAQIVINDPSKSILARRAKNAGFDNVDAYAAARPDEAAHWLRSHLDKAARSAQGRERVDLENTVGQLDELLDTSPGYAAARRQYGTESGVDRAREIGANFIAASRNQGNLDLLLEQIAGLPARERDVALLAIRDNLLSPVRGSGEDAPARISQLVSVGTLEGIERLGPAGKNLADDLRAIRDENAFLGQIDSGNPLRQSATFSNADARANAPDLYSGAIARTLNDGGGSSLPADIAISAITGTPIAPFTMAKIARGGLQSLFAPGRKSKEAMTQFLMARPRNALAGPATPDGGDIMPSAGIATGAERAAAQPTNAPTPNSPIRAGGFSPRGEALNQAGVAGFGSIAGSTTDLNGDGKRDWQDAAIGGATTLGLLNGPRALNALRGASRTVVRGVDDVASAGFAGPRAKGADLGAFKSAKQQIANGKDPREVWSETGWYKARNGAWKFEIDDSGASIANPAAKKLGEFLSHPTLFKNYPSLKNVRVEIDKRLDADEGYINTLLNKIVLGSPNKSTVIHEIQHAIQKREGVAELANEDLFDYDKLVAAGIEPDGPASRKFMAYYRSLMETEARASQARLDLPQSERRNLYPEDSFDINPEDVIPSVKGLRKSFAQLWKDAQQADSKLPPGGPRRPPKADSPEAIKAAVKGIATAKPKEPTRLERMVEEGKDAAVPPVNSSPREADALGAQAVRLMSGGKSIQVIHDQTGVVMVPYNGGHVPIVSPKIGPEELTRKFYQWLAEPPAKRPEWVKYILDNAPRKEGLMLTEKAPAPKAANALAEPPMPKSGFPYGAVALGVGAGAVTGIPAGIMAGTAIAREQDRKRNALAN